MKRFLDNLEKYLKYYFIISIVILSAAFLFILSRVYKVESYLAGFSREVSNDGKTETLIQRVDVCGEDCRKEINEIVSSAISTVSGAVKTPRPVVIPTVSPQKQTTYIPISGPITTTSTSWVDAPGTDVYIDLVNDYGKDTWVTWQAFLSIANGNGTAYARLFDVTHGTAVDGSEISVTSGASTEITSGRLNLWAGRNLYKVQLKSLNSFVVTFASGRIKINY